MCCVPALFFVIAVVHKKFTKILLCKRQKSSQLIIEGVNFWPFSLERNSALCGLSQSEYVRQLCRGIHPKPKPPDVFWRLMDELYKAHSDLKECAKYEPSALELCAEIERLVLDLQEAI